MSHLHKPFTLPKHAALLEELNDMSAAIKSHHIDYAAKKQHPEMWADVQAKYPVPTWAEVEKLIMKSYSAINEQREDPRRY